MERLAADGLRYSRFHTTALCAPCASAWTGAQAGEGRLPATVPLIFSADETTAVGRDCASPVSDEHGLSGGVFTGTVNWLQIDVGRSDDDRLIAPEECFRIAMARQQGAGPARTQFGRADPEEGTALVGQDGALLRLGGPAQCAGRRQADRH